MNSPIFTKYWTALLDLGIASEVDSAIALALRLAIDEAGQMNTTSAETAREDYRRLRNEFDEILGTNQSLYQQIDGLHQQLAELDANNADLIRKQAVANSRAAAFPISATALIPANQLITGNGATPAPFDWEQPFSGELADYLESLDKGRRTFRSLDKHVRLDLVQTALNAFAEPPTQAAFDAIKPEWMPTATSLCQTFACTWRDLPTLSPEKMQL